MDFLPRANKENSREEPYQIVQDLLNGQRFRFFHYIGQADVFQQREAQTFLTQLLSARESMLWFYSNSQVEKEFLTVLRGHPMEGLLRTHFQYSRKLGGWLDKRESFYRSPEGERAVLWQIYYRDLEAFGVEKDFHLYLNLKFHLSLAQYGDSRKNGQQLSRILHSLYSALKSDHRIPAAFLLETLKLILDFHPSHPQALFEYFEMLRGSQSGDEEQQAIFLEAFDGGAREKEFLLRLFESLRQKGDRDRLERMCETLWREQSIHLDAEFYLEASRILIASNQALCALFLALKAYSFKSHRAQSQKAILVALAALEKDDLFFSLRSKVEEQSFLTVRVRNHQELHFRRNSLDPWIACESNTLVLDCEENEKPCVQFLHSSGVEMIYYPEKNCLYELVYDQDGKFDLEKKNPVKSGNHIARPGDTFHFGHSSWDGSLGSLEKLTPFHFQRRE